jgi:subtilisin-like proprotein convertase family protein
LSRLELARRYALRRMAESGGGASAPSNAAQPRTSSSSEEQQRRERERRAMEEAARRRGSFRGTRESWHLTETLMGRHDTNRDGFLDANERRSMGLPAAADQDRDQRISRPELSAWLAEQEAQQGRAVSRELPAWFVEKDKDGDGQILMAEFADQWTDELIDEFLAMDTNHDGIVVAEECLQSLNRLREEYTNQRFQVIPVKGVIRSEIEVQEDRLIADLDVQLRITHTHDDHLNVFLIGADGQRVELFTRVGGQDDHFDNTILDEESPGSILRGRPPFAGRYQTEELSRGGPGLKKFYGQSMAGTWTLLVEANSDRPGVLHGWSLIFRRVEVADEVADEEEFD